MKKLTLRMAAIATAAALAGTCAAPASALEYGELAPDNAESRTVASLRIGRVGSFGDCTGTLVAPQWVLTARQCLESVSNEGTQARIAGAVYDADSWSLSPVMDAGLLHLTKPVEGVTPAQLADSMPGVGDEGNLYGWSSSSLMARKGDLPVARMRVREVLAGPGAGGSPAPAAPAPEVSGNSGAPKSSASVEAASPEGVESVPAEIAMGAGRFPQVRRVTSCQKSSAESSRQSPSRALRCRVATRARRSSSAANSQASRLRARPTETRTCPRRRRPSLRFRTPQPGSRTSPAGAILPAC